MNNLEYVQNKNERKKEKMEVRKMKVAVPEDMVETNEDDEKLK